MRWLLSLVAASLSMLAFADAEADLRKALKGVRSDQASEIVSKYKNAPSPLRELVVSFGKTVDEKELTALRNWLDARAELSAKISVHDAKAKATEILDNRLYADRGVAEDSNWLARALSKLRNIQLPKFNLPKGSGGPNLGFLGGFLQIAIYSLLGALVGLFVYVAVRHIKWKANLARKAKALLEDDEPVRSRDEWLEAADKLEREGKYREAIRALYLASLLAFDEHRVARFERRETNWEHLRRIQISPRLPQGLDFLPATQLFDRVWYGHQINGSNDVKSFRFMYQTTMDQLRSKA